MSDPFVLAASPRARSHRWLAATVFLLGSLVALGMGQWLSRDVQARQQLEFDKAAEALRKQIEARWQLPVQGLRGVRSALALKRELRRADLQAFVGARYYAEKPSDGPEWGLRFGLTFLFPK